MSDFLIYQDEHVRLYNCDCLMFLDEKIDIVFADPPFGIDLKKYERILFPKSCAHSFVMTNERELVKLAYENIDNFVRIFAVDTVVPNLISNKAPMQLCDFIAEFRFSKTRFINNNDGFSNLIRCAKVRNKQHYSQNFDKGSLLFAYFFKSYTNEEDTILDPFCGSGKSLIVARRLKRKIIGFELNKVSANHAKEMLSQNELF